MAAPSVQLHAKKFEELIRRRGRRVKWQEAIMCSCWNLDSGQPQYACQSCKGLGYTYAPAVEDVALVTSITHSKSFDASAGVFEIGDAVLTVGFYVPEANPNTGIIDATRNGRENPLFHVGMHDLITLTDDEYKTSEILVKGQDIYSRPADTLLNEDVVHIKSIRQSDPVTGDLQVFEADTDYRLEGNRIEWTGQNAPAEGTQYSVQYTHRPMFTVLTTLPTQRYQDNQDLPRNVALRYRAGGFDRQ
jgi:hypothetical protein